MKRLYVCLRSFKPARTLHVGFGHDEEVGGKLGAAATARLLRQRGVALEAILDEGGAIFSDGLQPITSRPIALVATAEKVQCSLACTARLYMHVSALFQRNLPGSMLLHPACGW